MGGFHLDNGLDWQQSGPAERSLCSDLPLILTGSKLLGTARNLGLRAWLSRDLRTWGHFSLLQLFFIHCFFMTPATGDCAHPDEP